MSELLQRREAMYASHARESLIDRLKQAAANLRRDGVLIAEPQALAADLDEAANEIDNLGRIVEDYRGSA